MRRPDGLHVLGIRHHGPGSARAVVAALDRIGPDVVLVEGPPDADDLLVHVAALEPPVALTVHAGDDARTGGLWPFARFSPEWQALLWAGRAGVPARFCDLAQSFVLAARRSDRAESESAVDPLGELARAAGHDDPERWWEDVVEHRRGGGEDDPLAVFAAIEEVMTVLRGELTHDPDSTPSTRPADLGTLREAAMRQVIRSALRQHEVVVVVCGAWHVPALVAPVHEALAGGDTAVLNGLPRIRTAAAWVPWTSGRLATTDGSGHAYGAGVASPGWYDHLFTVPDHPAERWLARTSSVLRAHDLPTSPASVVDAVRLAEALAALRGRSLPGLTELTEATLSVLCGGNAAPLAVVRRELHVGDLVGSVPSSVPTVPLAGDLSRLQRRLRMPVTATEKLYDLDLRRDHDLERSALLHRLALLDIGWGEPREAGGTGTFRESWSTSWHPELVLAVIDASRHGPTVRDAASARTVERAGSTTDLGAATRMVEAVLLADLPDALRATTAAVDRTAAGTGDVLALLAGVPALVRSVRYGTVRRTPTEALRLVLDTLLDRSGAGLVAGLAGLDEDGAARARPVLETAHDAVGLLADPDRSETWDAALAGLAGSERCPGLLVGRANRLLLDAGALATETCTPRLARALSGPPDRAGSWLEGFLAGGATLLLHDDVLFALLDNWLAELTDDALTRSLPLLRRATSAFTATERRLVGARAAGGPAPGPGAPVGDPGSDPVADAPVPAAADSVLARVRELVGLAGPVAPPSRPVDPVGSGSLQQ